MLLEVEVGGALAAADGADVGGGGGGLEASLALEDVEAALLAALVEDPAGEVGEGVAVGVGGDGVDAAEELGDAAEGEGGGVGGPAGGLVVEVPQDDDLLLPGEEDAGGGVGEHVDLGGAEDGCGCGCGCAGGGGLEGDGEIDGFGEVGEEGRRRRREEGGGGVGDDGGIRIHYHHCLQHCDGELKDG